MKSERRSARLPGYAYRSAGYYFVTVCVAGMKSLFGEVLSDVNNHGNINHDKYKGLERNTTSDKDKGPDKSCPYI